MTGILEFIRSLGFGGMLGAGFAGLIYSLSPTIFASVVNFNQILVVGGLLGAGFHGLIDRVIVKSVLGPITASTAYYSRILQLLFIRQLRLITKKRADELIGSLTQEYFLPPPERSSGVTTLPRAKKQPATKIKLPSDRTDSEIEVLTLPSGKKQQ